MAGRSGGVRVQVEGIDRMRGRLQELEPKLLEACKRAIQDSAEKVQETTAATVRVDTHQLQRLVRIRYSDGGLTATVGWFDQVAWYAILHEFGTRRFSAQPALHPALERERGQLAGRVRTEVRKVV